ncbi:bifunctional transcriptional activator/DNA repair enzyme AdaA [Alteribacillus bidgolensis]|uniref:AraC family transcriptional regulator, regulatory protein of adaptative response / methylphosphotriester-DNA alkyltransferase methyltransferase n=1 Tax=Alteribacillus bidgolensis TaxID=930129 RepID=A0A1G8FVZ0_9BACI|nr:Ada metal-binding domain-containing protein [Alteribacillus bidgolensis]SDH86291.1 AraC family transcriptional regulator, regulatory protein of adaptative response / methylphosphotriester-DNA alkyltransferase methyltransferase [Alteribacillus bidgolensis]
MVIQGRFSFNEMVTIANSCDPSYDGVFFYAVKTTGIFCRPSCKSKNPNKENITFFQTPEDAKRAGFRPCKRCQPDTKNFDPKLAIINDTKAYIHSHYKEGLTLTKIALHIGISPYYLARLFKTHTSKTLHSYLQHIRVNKAVHLLKTTELSVTDICYEVGFQNSSSFYHAFRKKTKQTPQQYRRGFSHDL